MAHFLNLQNLLKMLHHDPCPGSKRPLRVCIDSLLDVHTPPLVVLLLGDTCLSEKVMHTRCRTGFSPVGREAYAFDPSSHCPRFPIFGIEVSFCAKSMYPLF